MPQGPKINEQTKKTEETRNTLRQETMKNGFPIKKNKTEDNLFSSEIFQLCIFTVTVIIRIKMTATRNGGCLVAKSCQIL